MPDLAGALRIEAVGRLVQHQQVAGHQQCAGDRQPLPHPEGVRAVPLLGRGQQADPVQGGVDPGPGRTRVAGPVGRVQPDQVRPTGEVGVEGRALDEGADPGECGPAPAGISAPSSRIWPAVGEIRPSSIRIVVVLPEPFGPRKP